MEEQYAALSPGQEFLWQLCRSGILHNYVLPLSLNLRGSLNVTALNAAIVDLLDRHETLRTSVARHDTFRFHRVLRSSSCAPLVVTPSETKRLPMDLQDASLRNFDVECEIPLRAQLFALAPEHHVLLILVHYIAIDAWSIGPLIRDLLHAYSTRVSGRSPTWQALSIRYADYVRSQRDVLSRNADSQRLSFQHLPKSLTPSSRERTSGNRADSGGHLERLHGRLNSALHRDLLMLERSKGVTSFTMFHAVIAALLSSSGIGTDLPFVTVVSGRHHEALAPNVGLYANGVLLRTDTSGNPRFLDLLDRLRAFDLTDASVHTLPRLHTLPGTDDVNRTELEALLQIVIHVRETPDTILDMTGLSTTPNPMSTGIGNFTLAFDIIERIGLDRGPEGIDIQVAYRSDVVDRIYVAMILEALVCTVKAITVDSNQRIDKFRSYWDGISTEGLDGLISSPGSVALGATPRGSSSWHMAENVLEKRQYVPPHDPLQCQLAQIWEKLLGVQRIGIWDGFSSLGGTPVLFERMLSRVESVLGATVASGVISRDITIELLADTLAYNGSKAPLIEIQRGHVPSAPFFFLHGDINGGGLYTLELSRGFTQDQPFYILDSPDLLGSTAPESFQEIAVDHVQRLLQIQEKGPYYLGGYCHGGLIALEIARLLRRENCDVRLLAIVDPPLVHAPGAQGRQLSLARWPANGREKSPRFRNAWLFAHYGALMARYVPGPYPGPLTLFLPMEARYEKSIVCDQWRCLAMSLELHTISGNHLTCITRYGRDLGASVQRCLTNARK